MLHTFRNCIWIFTEFWVKDCHLHRNQICLDDLHREFSCTHCGVLLFGKDRNRL